MKREKKRKKKEIHQHWNVSQFSRENGIVCYCLLGCFNSCFPYFRGPLGEFTCTFHISFIYYNTK